MITPQLEMIPPVFCIAISTSDRAVLLLLLDDAGHEEDVVVPPKASSSVKRKIGIFQSIPGKPGPWRTENRIYVRRARPRN